MVFSSFPKQQADCIYTHTTIFWGVDSGEPVVLLSVGQREREHLDQFQKTHWAILPCFRSAQSEQEFARTEATKGSSMYCTWQVTELVLKAACSRDHLDWKGSFHTTIRKLHRTCPHDGRESHSEAEAVTTVFQEISNWLL